LKERKGVTEVPNIQHMRFEFTSELGLMTLLAACARYKDLCLMKMLLEFKNINEKISNAASTKLASHMWY